MSQLKKLGHTTIATILQCSGNGRGFFEHKVRGSQWKTGAAACIFWTGVPMKAVVDACGVINRYAVFMTSAGVDHEPTGINTKKGWDKKIAKEISYSRNVAKAHFPSDSDEGEKLGVAMLNFKSSPAKRKDPVVGTGKKPKGSGRRLYTDENPRDTVRIKFATPTDARATVAKVKRINKPFARKIQILTVGEQRAKVMGKSQVASIFKKGKDAIRKTKKV